MNKRSVCVVITARPSYSRVKTALQAIKDHPDLELKLIVAASALLIRYGSAIDFIQRDGFEVAAKVFNVVEGENLTSAAKTTGIGIMELSTVLDNLVPDIVVTIADRFETMATAIASSYMNIPLAHIQGGEVTGNIDEKVRHAISKLADIHFTATEKARERLIKLGEDPGFVFNTGCPSIDLASLVAESRRLDFDPYEKYGGVGNRPDISRGYLVVLQHPVTNEYPNNRSNIEVTLRAVHELDYPTFWFWPNIDAGSDGISGGIRAFRELKNPLNIHFFKNMDPMDFLNLLYHSRGLIGNSSVGIRECGFLGIPTVNIGSRQNRRERGNNVIDVDYNKTDILNAIKYWLKKEKPEPSHIYGMGDAGINIANVLAKVPLKYHKTITY